MTWAQYFNKDQREAVASFAESAMALVHSDAISSLGAKAEDPWVDVLVTGPYHWGTPVELPAKDPSPLDILAVYKEGAFAHALYPVLDRIVQQRFNAGQRSELTDFPVWVSFRALSVASCFRYELAPSFGQSLRTGQVYLDVNDLPGHPLA